MGTLEQKKQLQRQSNLLILTSILSFFGGIFVPNGLGVTYLTNMVSMIMVFAGAVMWLLGLMAYARSKGYSPIIGLLSFLGIIGLIILLVLPDQWKQPVPPVVDPNSNYPRDPNRW